MKGYHVIALLLASQFSNVGVMGQCVLDSDCNCIDESGDLLCEDANGVRYARTTCTSSDQCACFATGEGGLCVFDPPPPTTFSPSKAPSAAPTDAPPPPSASPTKAPSSEPSMAPSKPPTDQPTVQPSKAPSVEPTKNPSKTPTDQPTTSNPTESPTNEPTKPPTGQPTVQPSKAPSVEPTKNPSKTPTDQPTTSNPTKSPTNEPTKNPTTNPTDDPTKEPTNQPTGAPSLRPSKAPSSLPTKEPTRNPTEPPSPNPTNIPSVKPTNRPTDEPMGTPACPIYPTCNEPERSCGWGIWNIWTCQCDCAPGFCLANNQECYATCTTTLDFNPFGGCSPGCDCPWYRDPSGKTNCVTTVNFAGIYNIFRTAEQCCETHFSYLNIATCVADSEQSVDTARDTTTENANRPNYYYPDIYGRDNCIYHNGYFDWMLDSFSELYLFPKDVDCCSMWYPARENCPDLSDPTERDVIEKPYPVKGYFYPHETESNCRFGRNYPQWMAQALYLQDYLYTTPDECCAKWYPGAGGNCPLGPDDGVQEGSYWQSDVAFYPNWKGEWCNVGNDYPEWMADPTNIESHLFDSALACCQIWYADKVFECETNVIATNNGNPTDGEHESGEWYPTLAWPYDCVDDGEIPSYMLQLGYKQYYVFAGKAECCKAHYCSSMPSLFTRRLTEVIATSSKEAPPGTLRARHGPN